MRLDDLRVELGPRPGRQAVDLGFSLVRAHAGTVWWTWFSAWFPLSCVAMAIAMLPGGIGWAPLFLWWIRPLPERLVVAILAQGTFGQKMTIGGAWRSVLRGGMSGWFRFLSWGRPLGVARCLRQPVWQLEGADKALASRRATQLAGSGAGISATGWGIACIHLETALSIGFLVFAAVVSGRDKGLDVFRFFDYGHMDTAVVLVNVGAYALATGIMAPFYAAGGFALYLARRSELEAWDLEIALRRLAGRIGHVVKAGTLVVLLLAPAMVRASHGCPDSLVPASARHDSTSLIADPVQRSVQERVDSLSLLDDYRFWNCSTQWIADHEPERKSADPSDEQSWLAAHGAELAQILKWAFIVGAAALLVWLLLNNREVFSFGEGASDASVETPGPTLVPAAPREDFDGVSSRARSHWAQGRRREAMSLVYRATWETVGKNHVSARKGGTEQVCLRLLAKSDPDLRRCVEPMVRAWREAAWADRWPDDRGFEALLSEWSRVMERRS